MKTRILSLCLFVWAVFSTISVNAQAIRTINVAYDSPTIDLVFNNVALISKIDNGSASAVVKGLPPFLYSFKMCETGKPTSTPFATSDMTLASHIYSTLCLLGKTGKYVPLSLTWDSTTTPQTGNVKMRFVNAISDSSFPLSVALGGNLFVKNILQYKSSDFVEVPVGQSSTISFVHSTSGIEIIRYNGTFEAGNAYTVFFRSTSTGFQAQYVLESSVDEQKPMIYLKNDKIYIRGANISQQYPAVDWFINDISSVPNVQYLSGSATHLAFVKGNATAKCRKASAPTSSVLTSQTFDAVSDYQYIFVTYDTKDSMKSLLLTSDNQAPTSGFARVRIINSLTTVATINATDGDLVPLISNVQAGAAQNFVKIGIKNYDLRIKNTNTGSLLAQVDFPVSDRGSYTLFIVQGQNGVEVRLLDETSFNEQKPLTLLTKAATSQIKFRAANFINAASVPALQMSLNKLIIDEPLQFGFATNLNFNCLLGVNNLESFIVGMPPDNPYIATTATFSDQQSILALFVGDSASHEAKLFNSLYKQKSRTDSTLVRVINISKSLGEINVSMQGASVPFATAVKYGASSKYVYIPNQPEYQYIVKNASGNQIAYAIDAQVNQFVFTLIFVDGPTGAAIYVLPDESQAPPDYKPIRNLELTVTGVEDQQPGINSSVNISPNPIDKDANVQFSLVNTSQVSMSVFSTVGNELINVPAQFYDAGQHSLNLAVKQLPSGVYFVKIQAGSTVSIQRFVVMH